MKKHAKTIDELVHIGMAHAQEVGDCLEWQGHMSNKGTQPTVKHRAPGKDYSNNVSVPRVLWERKNGPVPAGKLVYRKCCNNACVLEDHIKVGSRADSMKARIRAGASKHSAATVISLTLAARRRAATVNTPEKARAVLSLTAEGLSIAQIADRTGVNPTMVKEIRQGRAWRELSNPFAGLFTRLAGNDSIRRRA